MSEIAHVLDQLDGTLLHDILVGVENQYENIAHVQKTWYMKTPGSCAPTDAARAARDLSLTLWKAKCSTWQPGLLKTSTTTP